MGILINLRDNYFYSATFSRVLYGRQEIILTIKVILFITRVRVINCEVMEHLFNFSWVIVSRETSLFF